jgi:hypothetical protein
MRNPMRIEKFIIVGGDGVERPVAGQDGADPAGLARFDAPGLHIVGYRSRHALSELPAEKFESYLREEGLESIIELRNARGQREAPGLELYSRCAKSLIAVGDDAAKGRDRAIGFRLELVTERNPYALQPGEDLPVRLLFEGKPLAGALVEASPLEGKLTHLTARTDSHGRAVFKIPAERPGAWLLSSVHMVEAPSPHADSPQSAEPHPDPRADWESLWASLTFEIHD